MASTVELLISAASPLAGVGLGYFLQGLRADKQLSEARKDAAQERLFDHRRVAYTDYLAAARKLHTATHASSYDRKIPDLAASEFDELWALTDAVKVYSTTSLAVSVEFLTSRIQKQGVSKGRLTGMPREEQLPLLGEVEAEVTKLLAEVRGLIRQELGIDHTSSAPQPSSLPRN